MTESLRDLGALLDADPCSFTKGVLGILPWKKQREVLRSVRDHKRTLVVSAHGVGKTCIEACVLLEWMATRPDPGAVVSASTLDQARDLTWAEARKLWHRALERGYPLGGEFQDRQWRFADGAQAIVQNPKNPVSAQGRHPASMLILLDEAEGVPAEHLDAYDSLMSGGYARLLVCLNPVLSSGWCFEAAKRPDLWNVIYISALDHPNVITGREVIPKAVMRAWCEEKLAQWGPDHPQYQARVLGRFPDAASDQLVTLPMLEGASAGTEGVSSQPVMGLDVARSLGGDYTVAHVLNDKRTTVCVEKWRSDDTNMIAGRARQIAERHGVPAHGVGIDICGGYGGGVYDTLKHAGFRCTPVDFGAAPVGDWNAVIGRETKTLNRRAELHWAGRELLRTKLACIPKTFGGTWSDLTAPIFWVDAKGRLVIEPKDDVKERIRRSPDEGDAFFLALGARQKPRDLTVFRSN